MLNRPVRWVWIAVALAVLGAWRAWSQREYRQLPGVLVAEAPVQTALPSDEPAFDYKHYRLKPLALFELQARVLGREDYRFDRLASLVPTDLALGWGRMSDSTVLKQIDISQSGRYFFWRVAQFPIPEDEIVRSAANMHLIPANAEVRRVLEKLRVGQLIALRGQLVEATGPGGITMRSSLRRDESGAGACELIWVEALQLR